MPSLIHGTTAAFLLSSTLCVFAQAPQVSPPPQANATSTLQVGTQLVLIDVVVVDRHGTPVHGLKAQDFHLSEDKTPQSIRNFEEHTRTAAPAPTATLKLPSGVFTDYTSAPEGGALNILLLDTLNTPTADQAYVGDQLKKYLQHSDPGSRIAIFGLANHLFLLQGFTSDTDTLKAAVEHRLLPRASNLLTDPTGNGLGDASPLSKEILGGGDGDCGVCAAIEQISANVAQFEAESAAIATQSRIDLTLDAFNALGHYLAAYPGRKNLIWFSGSFPLNTISEKAMQGNGRSGAGREDPFTGLKRNEEAFRETTSLLSRAQVAVYPVDARGIMTQPMSDVATSGQKYTSAFKVQQDLVTFHNSLTENHTTMDQLATDTGGKAFYNTNDLAAALSSAVDTGSNFYTLAYTPSNRSKDGKYRSVNVSLNDPAATPKLQLSYRHGYYSDDSHHTHKGDEAAGIAAAAEDAALHRTGSAYVRSIMSRGAPTPQEVVFKVRVLPASLAAEPAPAPGNVRVPGFAYKGSWQRFNIDFAGIARTVAFNRKASGQRTGEIEFIAYVYDKDGRLINTSTKLMMLDLTPENYGRFLQSSVGMHMEISVPNGRETYLRLAMHDAVSNRIGAIEIPVSGVSRLSPTLAGAAAPPK